MTLHGGMLCTTNAATYMLSRFSKLSVYFSWIVLIIFAYIREALRRWGLENDKASKELARQKVLSIDILLDYELNNHGEKEYVLEKEPLFCKAAPLFSETNLLCNQTYLIKDFVPLFADFESVYARNCYVRVRDVFERPIGSVPGATVNLIDRTSDDCNWTYKYPGTQTNVINVSSYNYLGFAQASGPCADAAVAQIDKEGLATCTTVHERGNGEVLNELI
ncbi:hypothetical protein TELCIR_13392, partial [Teladorsagia circumcincta]